MRFRIAVLDPRSFPGCAVWKSGFLRGVSCKSVRKFQWQQNIPSVLFDKHAGHLQICSPSYIKVGVMCRTDRQTDTLSENFLKTELVGGTSRLDTTKREQP